MGYLRAAFISTVVIPCAFATKLPFKSTLPSDQINSTSVSNNTLIGQASNAFTSCSASVISWLGLAKPVPDAFINNCVEADELLQVDVNRYSSQRLEFVPLRRRARSDLEVMRTPRKYTAGMLFYHPYSVSRKAEQSLRHHFRLYNYRCQYGCRSSKIHTSSSIPCHGCRDFL